MTLGLSRYPYKRQLANSYEDAQRIKDSFLERGYNQTTVERMGVVYFVSARKMSAMAEVVLDDIPPPPRRIRKLPREKVNDLLLLPLSERRPLRLRDITLGIEE